MELYDVLAVMQKRLRETGLYRLDGTTVVDAELKAYAAGFQVVMNDYETLAKELAVNTAESFGLAMREGMLGIPLSHLPLGQRRAQLLQNLSVCSNDYTVDAIEKALDGVGITARITERPDDKAITVTVTDAARTGTESQSAVQALAALYLPAHLHVFYDFSQTDLTA